MTHSDTFCFFVNFSKKMVEISVHFGVYNPVFVCQHARRGLFFQKKVTFDQQVTYIFSKNSKNLIFCLKNRHIFPFPRFTIERPAFGLCHL